MKSVRYFLKFESIIYIILIINITFVLLSFVIMRQFNPYITFIIDGFLLYISWKLVNLSYEIDKIRINLRKLYNNLNRISSRLRS